MKQIEVTTAHNVIIQYQVADIGVRLVAFFIDALILFIYYIALDVLIGSVYESSGISEENPSGNQLLVSSILLLPLIFYSFIMETFFHGQSFGKKILGIKVISLHGSNASLGDFFLRWSFRLIDIVASFGSTAVISILIAENKQRLGGVVSNTAVILLKSNQQYTLNSILKLDSKKEHTPKYKDVIQLSDEDVLLIKNTLTRYQKHKNEQHKAIIQELTDRTLAILKLETQPKNNVGFLKRILKDYIILTRS